jgi:hypothetical protein
MEIIPDFRGAAGGMQVVEADRTYDARRIRPERDGPSNADTSAEEPGAALDQLPSFTDGLHHVQVVVSGDDWPAEAVEDRFGISGMKGAKGEPRGP